MINPFLRLLHLSMAFILQFSGPSGQSVIVVLFFRIVPYLEWRPFIVQTAARDIELRVSVRDSNEHSSARIAN
jgi:hypothetical protein